MLELKHRIAATSEGDFRRVPKTSIQIDLEHYQRDKTRIVNQILREGWSWPKCGALSISQREDGTLWAFDGGNRLRAALQLEDILELPCMVFYSDNYKQEAGTFVDAQLDRIRIGGLARHKAAVAAGGEAYIFVNNLVKYGEQVYGVKAWKCVAEMVKMSKDASGRNCLRKAWSVASEAFAGEVLPLSVLRALYWIETHAKNGSLADTRYRRAVVNAGPQELIAAQRRGSIIKNSAPNWGKALLVRINKGLRKELKIEETDE